MDIVEIERALTCYFAETLGLKVDVNIFRGGIPERIESGIGVMLGSEIKDNSFRARTWNVQVLGKFAKRDGAMRLLSRLGQIVPSYGFTFDRVVFRSLSPRGSAEPYLAADAGKEKWFASFNMTAVVLTCGAQIS